jgi:hypothetical protein
MHCSKALVSRAASGWTSLPECYSNARYRVYAPI